MTGPLKHTIHAEEIELQKQMLRALQKYFKTYAKLAVEAIEKLGLEATSAMLAHVNTEYANGVDEQLEALLRIAPDGK